MSRCEICGSKGDCDEFCGDSFSDMIDQILELREEINSSEKLLKEKESEIEDQYTVINKLTLMTAKAVEALKFCFDNDELEIYQYVKKVQKRAKETIKELGYSVD